MNYYPHFAHQISQLKSALKKTDDEQKQRLISKWLEQLEVINSEIAHLEKIELLADKLTQN